MIPEMEPDVGGSDDYKENLANIVMCPDCKEYPPNLIEEFSSGDVVCGTCGVVVGDRIIDVRSEWRTFANDESGGDDPSRVGEAQSTLADDEGLRTGVDLGRNSNNLKLAGKLNSINKKSQSDKTNNDLQEGFKMINKFIEQMRTTNQVGQSAMHIYKLAYEHGQLKGKNRDAVIAGCIFIACRQVGPARTFREIYSITKVSKKEIGRVFKSLEAFLTKIKERDPKIGLAQGLGEYKSQGSTSAEELCTRYCNNMRFKWTMLVENLAKHLAKETAGISALAGRSPLSICAACIYFASHWMKDGRTSKEVSNVCGVSDGTVKTAYKHLYNVREQIVAKTETQFWPNPEDPRTKGIGPENLPAN